MIEDYKKHAACSWVSCWTAKEFEDRKMWEVYSPASSSVVIRSNVRRLKLSLRTPQPPLTFGRVFYTEPAVPRPIMPGWNGPSYRKPERFAWEQEFRVLRNLGPDECMTHDDPEWYGRLVMVNLLCLVGQIRLHPEASGSDYEAVRALVGQHAPKLVSRVRRSALPSSTGAR